jgi:hypothetical protein
MTNVQIIENICIIDDSIENNINDNIENIRIDDDDVVVSNSNKSNDLPAM